jgi:hypothetical protein
MSWANQRGMLTIRRDAGNLEFLLVKLSHAKLTKPSWCLDFSGRSLLEQGIGSSTEIRSRTAPRSCLDPLELFQLDSEEWTIKLIGRKFIEVVRAHPDHCVEHFIVRGLGYDHLVQRCHRSPAELIQPSVSSELHENDIVCGLYGLRKPTVSRPETCGSYSIVCIVEQPA